MAGKYDDIIHLPRPVSQRHAPMTVQDRAAQFAPFAALTGYEDVIEESGRLTDARIDLDEGEVARLNEVLAQIKERDYYRRYMNSGKKILLIGVNFDMERGQIKDWIMQGV